MSDSDSQCRVCLQPIEPGRNICWVCYTELKPPDPPGAELTRDVVHMNDGELQWEGNSYQIPNNATETSTVSTASKVLAILGGTAIVGSLSVVAVTIGFVLMILACISSVITAFFEICTGGGMGP